MSLFYDIFIYPLELIMKLVLEYALDISDNPLFSLFCVSIIVTAGSLPLYHIAETWQDKEREIQKKLKPKVAEFKSVFKGATLNAYLQALYRQNNYHPIYAVRTSFGLLIQIPFFFAAYHLLSNYQALNGVETILFKDLGKPDELLNLGGLTINIMPFVMTGFNLISASIYSRKTNFKENLTLYGMALLFLVVLYNSTSALLFYWTCNNLFSLIKNIVYNVVYKDGSLLSAKDKKDQLWLKKIIKTAPEGWITFILIVISAATYYFGIHIIPKKENVDVFTLLLVSIPLFALAFYAALRSLKKGGAGGLALKMFNFSALLAAMILLFLRILQVSGDNTTGVTAIYILIAIVAFDLVLVCLKLFDLMVSKIFLPSDKQSDKLFTTALSAFTVLTFIALPLTILSSGSSADFEEGLFYYANYLIIFSIIFLVATSVTFRMFSPKWKRLFSALFAVITFSSLINAFVFTGNYGDMSHFVFSDDIIISNLDRFLNVTAIVLVAIVIAAIFLKKKIRIASTILALTTVSLLFLSISEAYTFTEKRIRDTKIQKKVPGEKLFTFSKTQKNVIILMIDRFIGGYIPQLMEIMPEMKENLDGFVWYPETFSPGSYTISGVPAIMGGWDYYVKNVNATRQDVPLLKKLDESAKIMPYNFSSNNFDVGVYTNDLSRWLEEDDKKFILDSTNFVEVDFAKYRKRWLAKSKVREMKEDNQIKKKMLMFGLFRVSPLILRFPVYNDGKWLVEKDEEYKKPDKKKFVSFHQKSKWRRNTTLKYYAFLDLLPEMSAVSDDKKGKFYYFNNDLTHEPHTINMNFEFQPDGKVYYPKKLHKKFNKSINSLKHLYTDGAALKLVSKWITWMKKNGVYDNTRIIMVSDHGRDVFNPAFKDKKIKGGRKKSHPSYFNNLLLFKDFNSRGELKTDKSFMTSMDVPTLAMKEIFTPVNPFTGTAIESPEKKFPFITYDTQWRSEKQGKFKYKYHEAYEIKYKKDLFYPSRWKIIDEKD